MPDNDDKAPVGTDTGQAVKDSGDAHLQTFQVPEKLRGKSPEELARAYVALEKKLGEQSKEVSDARKRSDDALKLQSQAMEDRKLLQELTELIYADPERIKAVESWYAKKTGKAANQSSNGESSKPDDSSPSSQTSSDVLDTRRALQDQIFDEFYARYGIDKLPSAEKQEALKKISLEFADLFDPTGKRTISQIVAGRPLTSLRRDLEKAYRLSNISQSGNVQGDMAQEQNNQAAIGGMSGKTVREDQIKLTSAEEQMASNLGIPPEKYLEKKKQILKERGSVS
jgi:hypothetical protein